MPIALLPQFQQWEEEWVNRVVDERMAGAEPGIPLAEVLADTAANPSVNLGSNSLRSRAAFVTGSQQE